MAGTLNEQQQAAVECIEGPLLVLAGAGSGKTRVVTARIAHLLQLGVPASRVLAVTFTNKAAGEMRERVAQLTNSHVTVCTFHSLGLRMLREKGDALGYRRDFAIYDAEDSKKLIKNCLINLELGDKRSDPDAFKHLISRAKNDLLPPGEIDTSELPDHLRKIFPQIYQLYQAKLKEYQAVDFDDLIFLPVRLLREHPHILEIFQHRWDFVLIDEYQDTNAAQYTLMRMLVEKSRNLCVVGDPDQSIYSWRGANLHNILNFERDYPGAKVINLLDNYRSTAQILDAANAVIGHNRERYEKRLRSTRGVGEKLKIFSALDDRAEASFVVERVRHHVQEDKRALCDLAILYRTHFQSRAFEDALLSYKLPYVILGGISFYQRREVKDLLAYLRVVHSGVDFVSLARTINLPKRGIGDTTMEKLQLAAARAHLGVFDYCVALLAGQVTDNDLRLTARLRTGLQDYVQVILELRRRQSNGISLKDLVIATIELSGYLQALAAEPDTFAERKENLDSLIAKAFEWEEQRGSNELALFLDELTLKSSAEVDDSAQERITLMTLHHAKGLEFPLVFLVGMEEGLFPHANSLDDVSQLEEERRLCYVGMTRARDLLYLSHARNRLIWGMARQQASSRFLSEIPAMHFEKVGVRARGPMASARAPGQSMEVDRTIYTAGDVVMHADFGVGTVRTVQEQPGIGLIYTVFFVKSRTAKSLVAKYAHLSRVA